ncbi:poly-gamma-glutamate biosynthesis protein PgsC [Leptospira sp. WS92.C1]
MEVLTLSIGLGILLGFFFWEKTGIHPGGWVVPGYMALTLLQPWTLVEIVLSSLLTFVFYRLSESQFLSFGRRKIVLILVGSILISSLVHWIGILYWRYISNSEFRILGHIVPGLITLSMEKQGVLRTISGITICSCILRLVLIFLLGETLSL